MGNNRSLMRKKKHDGDACCNSGVTLCSDLNQDVLILVMMKLGVLDFFAFNRVCKSWRSVALSNRNMFMMSRPMSISVSTLPMKRECYLKDFEGRRFKITLPHNAFGMTCIGITGGYLILYCWRTGDYMLVNLITRHELHFRDVPVEVRPNFWSHFRGIIVFSPTISGWVFVVLNNPYSRLLFCIAGKREWTEVSHHFIIRDLHVFKGKIYTVHSVDGSDDVRLCEMRLSPDPKLVVLKTEKFPEPNFRSPRIVSSAENLYVIDKCSKHPFKIHELDFGEMKWVSREKTGEKYAFFYYNFKFCETFTLRKVWADIYSQYGRYFVPRKNGKGGVFYANMWYFLDDYLNVNLIHI